MASLPDHFREHRGPGTDIAMISGDFKGWHERAQQAIESGSVVILAGTAEVTALALTSLARDAAHGGGAVTCDTGYACAPAWLSALAQLQVQAAESTVLDSVAAVGRTGSSPAGHADLRNALVGQLLLAHAVLGRLDGLRPLYAGDSSYVLGGHALGAAATFAGALSAGPSYLQLDMVGARARARVRFETEYLAQSAYVSVFGPDGEHIRDSSYESGHRVCWLNLHAALSNGTPVLISANQLISCVAMAENALGV
jgi:hypothetical protein